MGKNGIKYESQEGNGLVTMTSVGPTRVVGLEGLVTISHFLKLESREALKDSKTSLFSGTMSQVSDSLQRSQWAVKKCNK